MFLFSNTQTGRQFNKPWDSILDLVLVILLKILSIITILLHKDLFNAVWELLISKLTNICWCQG